MLNLGSVLISGQHSFFVSTVRVHVVLQRSLLEGFDSLIFELHGSGRVEGRMVPPTNYMDLQHDEKKSAASLYILTWNPNDPLFLLERPCFGGLTPKK